ncbi:MAG: ATP-binding protein [Bdellovibrionota bacterium]
MTNIEAPLRSSAEAEAREKTDLSLEGERSKVDESLIEEKKAIENFAASKLEIDRNRADKAVDSSREKSDKDQIRERELRDLGQTGLKSAQWEEIAAERHQTDQRLQAERARADEAQQKVRTESDAAAAKERERLNLLAETFLSLERRTTDADLLEERNQADRERFLADESFKDESGSHSLTRNFMAIVSHDLKNPLNSISMAADLLLMDATSPKMDPQKAIQYATSIKRNAAVMDRLITDLLDIERIAAGKVEMKKSKQDVVNLLEECLEIFDLAASKRSITLSIDSSTFDPLLANIDGERIGQVLSNLVGNALKFTPEGGSITLEAHRNGSQIEVCVSDTGKGILVAEQSRIFEKFSQLGTLSRQGLGLGLHISKWIIEAHEGKIWVKSEPGKGSTFTFSLPCD